MADSKKVAEVLRKIAQAVEREKDALTALDRAIGDGDHGINLARGFGAVAARLDEAANASVGAILKMAGMTLVSTVGGASGPLYGTAFLKAGAAVGEKTEMDSNDFIRAFDAAIAGIAMRGKAQQGEKTMLDALIPALNALREDPDFANGLRRAVKAAEAGVEYTKTIIATKGRASYLGNRSIGHADPGAASSLLILQVIAQEVLG